MPISTVLGGELRKLATIAKNAEKDALCGFKVIQGHRVSQQAKRHMRLPVSG